MDRVCLLLSLCRVNTDSRMLILNLSARDSFVSQTDFITNMKGLFIHSESAHVMETLSF